MAIRRITPFLWYDSNAEEAAKLYVSLFGNSRITLSRAMATRGRARKAA